MSRGRRAEAGEDGFLARWSRRKQQARDGRQPGDEVVGDAVEATPNQPPGDAEIDESTLSDTELLAKYELPDPAALTASDDVAAFMRSGVPARLRNLALRRMWRLDPVLANLDGLNDYDGDYTDAAYVVANLKTLYQVGRGGAAHIEDAARKLAEAGGSEVPAPAGTAAPPEAISNDIPEAVSSDTHADVIAPPPDAGPPDRSGDLQGTPTAPVDEDRQSAESRASAPRRRRMVFIAQDDPAAPADLRLFNK